MLPRPLLVCFFCLINLLAEPGAASTPTDPPPERWTAEQAVHFALAHSPDARAAGERIRAAEADIRVTRAAFLPQLGVSGEYGRTDNPMYSFGNILNQGLFTSDIDFNDPGITDTLQARATLQYRVYNGGHDRAALTAAEAQAEATEHDRAAVRSRLGYEVVRAFHTIRQAEDTVSARQSAVAAITASLEVARTRHAAGTLLREEVLNLEVQQARAEEQRIQARHGLELARRGFSNLLGLSGGEVRLDPAGSEAQAVPDALSAADRPELAAMAATVRAFEAEVDRAGAGHRPTTDAFASYQTETGLEHDGSGNSWLAGVRLNYTLFDGRRTDAALARATARLAGVRAEQRKLQLAVELEAEQARLALAQEEERLKVTARMVAAAAESARLARLRFQEGVLLASDLIDTENRLTDARISHALATAARAMAVADLRRAVGLTQFNEKN
jgi:outer membrane protein TolC